MVIVITVFGAPHLLSAPSNLPHRIWLPKLCYSYVEWTAAGIELLIAVFSKNKKILLHDIKKIR